MTGTTPRHPIQAAEGNADESGNFLRKVRVQLLRPYGWPAIIIVVLVFATWKRYSNWPTIFDIGFWDETFYLYYGIFREPIFGVDRLPEINFGNYETSPLYEVYYYIIGRFSRDARTVYFVGGLTIQLIALFSIGFVAGKLSRSLAITTLVFGLTLCSPFLLTWPRVSYLAVTFIVIGIWLATLETRFANRLAITLLVSFTLCFIRPEFILTMYATGAGLFGTLLYSTLPELYKAIMGRSRIERPALYRLAVYLCAVSLLCSAWSFPMLQGEERAMLAFGQHYSVRWVNEHGSSLDPMFNYAYIVNKMFPGAKTPVQAFLLNPIELSRFVLLNVLETVPVLLRLLVSWRDIVVIIGLTSGLLALLFLSARSMYHRMQGTGLQSVFKKVPLVESGLYAVAALAALIFVYPDSHYAVMLPPALMPCCVAIARWRPWSKAFDVAMGLLAAMAIAVATRPLPVTDQPILQTINVIRDLRLPMNRMLEVEGGWCLYLEPPCEPEWGWMYNPTISALELIIDRKTDAIMVSDDLLRFFRSARHDQSLDEFLNSVSGNQWHRYDVGDGFYLLHREVSGASPTVRGPR
jgi:hypothetical protein